MFDHDVASLPDHSLMTVLEHSSICPTIEVAEPEQPPGGQLAEAVMLERMIFSGWSRSSETKCGPGKGQGSVGCEDYPAGHRGAISP